MAESRENRKYSRVSVQLPVTCLEMKKTSKGSKVYFFSSDISVGGVLLATDEIFPLGTKLHCEITLPDPRTTIHTTGKVVRCVDTPESGLKGMGLELEIRNEDEKGSLETFIARKMAEII